MSKILAPDGKLFRIKKYREIMMPFKQRIGLQGLYRIEIVNMEDGRERWATDWFSNNITDAGLDQCTTTDNRYNSCHIGTGNTAPSNSDTGLVAYTAGTNARTTIAHTSTVADGYAEHYMRYNFATGAVVGNMAEVGLAALTTNGSTLFSRELIRDSGGSPTTITVASSEALRVHHKLRHYWPQDDATGSVGGTLNGSPATRNYTRRASEVDSTSLWAPRSDSSGASSNEPLFGNLPSLFASAAVVAYTGAIGAIDERPAGTSGDATGGSTESYSPGSHTRIYYAEWNTGAANQANKSFWCGCGGGFLAPAGFFQVEFDTAITKTSSDVMTIGVQVSWGRYSA